MWCVDVCIMQHSFSRCAKPRPQGYARASNVSYYFKLVWWNSHIGVIKVCIHMFLYLPVLSILNFSFFLILNTSSLSRDFPPSKHARPIHNSLIGYLQVLENDMFWTLCQMPFMHCCSLMCGVLICVDMQHSLFLVQIQGHGDMQGHPPIEHAWLTDKAHFAKRKQRNSQMQCHMLT